MVVYVVFLTNHTPHFSLDSLDFSTNGSRRYISHANPLSIRAPHAPRHLRHFPDTYPIHSRHIPDTYVYATNIPWMFHEYPKAPPKMFLRWSIPQKLYTYSMFSLFSPSFKNQQFLCFATYIPLIHLHLSYFFTTFARFCVQTLAHVSAANHKLPPQSVQWTKQQFWLIRYNKNSLDSLDFCAQRKETNIIYNMTRKPYIKSSICALQHWGGYGCHSVIDNPLNKTYYALSWLFAATSAFVYSAVGSALGVVAELSPRQWSNPRRICRVSLPLHFTPYTRTRFSAKR